ncbi:MAG: hypothetical protein RLZZ314_575 [Bacteroidota bacterium]|jgi:phosphate starvation-inducible PhoH-like protein
MDAADVASGAAHVDKKVAPAPCLLEERPVDVRDAIAPTIDVTNMTHQGIVFNDRSEIFHLRHQRCGTTKQLWNAPLGQVGRRRHKERALWKRGFIAVCLDSGHVKHHVRNPASHQLEHPRIGSNEILVLPTHNPMGMVGGFNSVQRDDVNRSFGETRHGRPEHKSRMNRVKFSNAVGQIDNLRVRHSAQDTALEHARVDAVGTKIAEECDWWHERKGEKATFVLHMHESILSLEGLDLMTFLGQGNANLRALQTRFPKLKIVARGTDLKAIGDREDLGRFEEVMRMVIWHVDRFNSLDEDDIERLTKTEEMTLLNHAAQDDVIVYGPGGLKVTARTPNQRRLVDAIREHDMVFAVGPAGTGKTYTAVAMAVAALKDRRVRKIILTRPAVEAGENLGFLPGDLKEKLDPYLQPLYDALTDMLPYERVADHLEKGVIEVAPLAFMRGRTLDKAFVILDEAQNATSAQMRMFLTRMGKEAKFVITGDGSQVDLPRNQRSGLIHALRLLEDVEGISTIRLTGVDVIRHRLVGAIIDRFDQDDARRAEVEAANKEAKIAASQSTTSPTQPKPSLPASHPST